jgi:septum formation protein
MGKPADADDAARMLRALSGKQHEVVTGICLKRGARVVRDVATTAVWFAPLSDAEIENYVSSGEPMDKAGAYGIQGYGATIVERVDGDYFAVMGLPLNRLTRLLESLGLVYPFGPVRLGTGATTA